MLHYVEFMKISTATAIGFAVMGFIGFFVRLIHIPVNSILLGMYIVTSFTRLNFSCELCTVTDRQAYIDP